jgi:hypothetical protein
MAVQRITVGTILAMMTIGTVLSVLGVFVATHSISNTVYVKTVGVSVYWDIGCTQEVTSISWGYMEPGSSMDKTVYVKNEGTVVMKLSMTTESWNPASAASYITQSWNRENNVLDPGSVVQATLTLSLSSTTTGITNASFDTVITGTEQT